MNSLTKVEVGLSTYVGYGLALLGYLATFINNISTNSNLLHVSPSVWIMISTGVAVATTLGRQVQAALQNQGIGSVPAVAVAAVAVPVSAAPAAPVDAVLAPSTAAPTQAA